MREVIFGCLMLAVVGCGTTATVTADGGPPCNGVTCASNEACVVLTAGGGACELPDDAGVCPNGSHTTGCCDNTTTTYTCEVIPAECDNTLSCPCASSLCQCGGCTVTSEATLACACEYP